MSSVCLAGGTACVGGVLCRRVCRTLQQGDALPHVMVRNSFALCDLSDTSVFIFLHLRNAACATPNRPKTTYLR
jgi:hypothetical protein